MADSAPLPENSAVPNSQQPPESDAKTSQSDPSPALSSSSAALPPPPQPPPSIQPYSTVPPSFRPATPAAPVSGVAPPFSPFPSPNLAPNFANPSGVQPPGVAPQQQMIQAPAGGAGAVPMPPYGQLMRPFAAPVPNGYTAIPQQQGAMMPPVS